MFVFPSIGAIHLALRSLLGLVFVFAGAGKLSDIHGFEAVIIDYGLLPVSVVEYVAVGLPILEIASGLALMFWLRGSLLTIAGQLAVFVMVLLYGMTIGLENCGCFGSADPTAANSEMLLALLRDLGFLALCGWLAWKNPKNLEEAQSSDSGGLVA